MKRFKVIKPNIEKMVKDAEISGVVSDNQAIYNLAIKYPNAIFYRIDPDGGTTNIRADQVKQMIVERLEFRG